MNAANIPPEMLQGAQGSGGSPDEAAEQAKRLADEQQRRRDLLSQILDSGARERCA